MRMCSGHPKVHFGTIVEGSWGGGGWGGCTVGPLGSLTTGVTTVASTWFIPSDLFRSYSQTYDRVANFSQNKRVFSCNPMRDLRESRYKTAQAYFCLPESRLQASRNSRTRTTLGHFQTVRLRANSGETGSGQNGGHDRGWSARPQQLSVNVNVG